MPPLFVRNFDDIRNLVSANTLRVDVCFAIETRSRGLKPHQGLTSFARNDGSTPDQLQEYYNVVINWPATENSVQGILVEASVTGILVNSERETIIFAKFLKEYIGQEFPIYKEAQNFEFCRSNINLITAAGARLRLVVDNLGWFPNQCISYVSGVGGGGFTNSTFSSSVFQFVISYALGANESWIGCQVQVAVTSGIITSFGYCVKCVFVKMVSEKSVAYSKLNPESLRQYQNYLQIEQLAREENGEAVAYNINVETLRSLKNQGITDATELAIYARQKYLIEKDYTLKKLKNEFTKVYEFWYHIWDIEVNNSILFAAIYAGCSLDPQKPYDYCTLYNGRNSCGIGKGCAYGIRCQYDNLCILCNSKSHGLFFEQDSVWKCPKYRKYREELTILQGKWLLADGKPIQEVHIRELFGMVPFALFEPLHELQYEQLMKKHQEMINLREAIAKLEKLPSNKQSAKHAIKVEDAKTKLKNLDTEVLSDHNYYLLELELNREIVKETTGVYIGTAVNTSYDEIETKSVADTTVSLTLSAPCPVEESLIETNSNLNTPTISTMDNDAWQTVNSATISVSTASSEVDAEDLVERPMPTVEYPFSPFAKLIFNKGMRFKYDMGTEVYRAELHNELTESRRPVAVKLFDKTKLGKIANVKTFRDLIKEELKAMEKIKNSQHIVAYIGTVDIQYPLTDGGAEFVVVIMEQEEFQLEQFLQTYYDLDDNNYLMKIRPLIRQLTQAYIDIHDSNIIHRDVKPENILVSSEGIIKVCDFGHCKSKDLQDRYSSHISAVRGATYLGTIHKGCWMAPEVIECRPPNRRNRTYSCNADLWPLGLVFYYIASRGYSPIQYEEDCKDASTDMNFRLELLNRSRSEELDNNWRLCEVYPMLFDLIEHMVRPYSGNNDSNERIGIRCAAAHPFFWDHTTVDRLIVDFATEFNNHYNQRQSFMNEFNTSCQMHFANGYWDQSSIIFRNLEGNYDETKATALLRAVRNVLLHENPTANNTTGNNYVSNHHHKGVVISWFLRHYWFVLCELFRISITTVMVREEGKHVRKYGDWSNPFTESFKFTFSD